MPKLTTAEATIESLLAHGIDTIYALPGVHNDDLFDALFKAGDRMRVVHSRHEQGAAYMALGAALASGKPQAYSVVPGPGLLNTGAALLTAYSMNAPVLALVGQIPDKDIGRSLGHLHEINDQAGIIARLVDHSAIIRDPAAAPKIVAEAVQAMRTGRPGPAAIECAIDMWGRAGDIDPIDPFPAPQTEIDEDAVLAAAKILGQAERPFIVVGGGAQDAPEEVAALSDMLQAPVMGYRRGRGVLSSRNPFSVTLPLGREIWGEADAAIGIGTHMAYPFQHWGLDDGIKIVRIDADPAEPARFMKPDAALIGDAKPILRRLLEVLPGHNKKRASRKSEMEERQAKLTARFRGRSPRSSAGWKQSARSCRTTAYSSMK
jgi:acetolactate synthase I/II/III large subunit